MSIDVQQRVRNVANEMQIRDLLTRFWANKSSRHDELIQNHLEIIDRTLLVDPYTLERDLFRSKLIVGNFSEKLDSLLAKTALKGDLSPEYIDLCLQVTSKRPVIGRGEFLFTASFANISFCEDRGDLFDLDTGSRIEVKGESAHLGNGDNDSFRPLSGDTMPSLFTDLGIPLDGDRLERNLSMKNSLKLGDRMRNLDIAHSVFSKLQNTASIDDELSEEASLNWLKNRDLLRCVAAMHMLSYSRIENIDYFLFLNDHRFRLVSAPKSFSEALDAASALDVKSWRSGEYGIRIALKDLSGNR